MMINRLKKHYPHAIPSNSHAIPFSHQLTLVEINGESLTLDRRELTKEEIKLLETLFENKKTDHFYPKNHTEEMLHTWLIKEESVEVKDLANAIPLPIRFIHFHVKGPISSPEDWEEALKNLFSISSVLLWKNPQEGLLIQTIDSHFEEDDSVESIVDTIASDFFVQISFYVGSPITEIKNAQSQYKWEIAAFQLVKTTHPSKNVFIEQEVIPYMIIKDLTEDTKEKILKMLQPVIKDTDLLESVKIYLECNMNASLAAKKMYMHRNTIQYRVDKFIEKTSIDIKQFPNAVAVYFMFVALQNMRTET